MGNMNQIAIENKIIVFELIIFLNILKVEHNCVQGVTFKMKKKILSMIFNMNPHFICYTLWKNLKFSMQVSAVTQIYTK